MWTTFKVFIEFVTMLLLFYVLLFWQGGMWDLSFLTRDQMSTPALEGEVLINNICLFLVALGLHCCMGFSLVAASTGTL